MFKLKIISSTVRPGRKGPVIAQWIADQAIQNGNFEVEVLDLGKINLPMINEPNHPSLKKYEHEHTKYLYQEWGYKVAGLVSYGGVSGGTWAANLIMPAYQQLKYKNHENYKTYSQCG